MEDFWKSKGIAPSTRAEWHVIENHAANQIEFGYPQGVKIRRLPRDFEWEKGSKQTLYYRPEIHGDWSSALLVEGETDTLVTHQEMSGMSFNVYGLPGLMSWKPEWGSEFSKYDHVYVILDNDDPYKTDTNKAWERIKRDLPNAKRIILPPDVKDMCEFFQSYSRDTLLSLIEEAGTPKFYYKPLDLSIKPPPYDWLVEGVIARNDVVILLADQNVGKSWLHMDLTTAVVVNRKWCGWNVLPKTGKVYVIDEENTRDIIHNRLSRLGLPRDSADSVRYLSHCGIRLDRGENGERVYEEVMAFKPDLIVIDSFQQMHSSDENHSGEMNRILNDKIKPLARDSGAAVLLLHHTNKVDSNDPTKKLRGSSAIPGNVDCGLELKKWDNHGQLVLAQFRSRRSFNHPPVHLLLRDCEDGSAEIMKVRDGNGDSEGPF